MLRQAFRAGPERKIILVAAHLSFIVMNMATMPHWLIEGNVLYGILCGYTLYERRLQDALNRRNSAMARESVANVSAQASC